MSAATGITIYTDAPLAYDWSWTKHLGYLIYVDKRTKQRLRRVDVEDPYHARNQMDRYASGGYWALNPKQFNEFRDSFEVMQE